MTTFDPWTATLEQAQAQPDAHGLHGAVCQCVVAQELTANKEQITTGDGYGVLAAVAQCGMYGLAMPNWLATAYLRRYRAVNTGKFNSWDAEEAFGRPYPKGTQMAATRRRRESVIRVANAVTDAVNKNPEVVIDAAFWEGIGKVIGEGKTSAQKLHAQAVLLGWTIDASARKSKLIGKPTPTKPGKLTGLHRRR